MMMVASAERMPMITKTIGALILSILQTGLLLSGVVQFWQLVAVGLLLIAVVAIRMLRESPEART